MSRMKFDVTRATKAKRMDKVMYQGKVWNVVGEDGTGSYRHIYYVLRKPYARENGPIVRSDKLTPVNG